MRFAFAAAAGVTAAAYLAFVSFADSAPRDPYADHVAALEKRLEAKGFKNLAFTVEKPFVVIGNRGAKALERDAGTVRWAVTMLEQDFFTARPNKILDVYLFGDAASYERGVKTLTGEAPDTPYGFYSPRFGGLFMNIATGGGTLVHEIVHPYVEADFPNAPPWLNEGLGSLFEQSAEKGGHIVGLTNWRLAGLKRADGADTIPSFEKLTHYTAAEFYGDDSGVNYAASRYLLYYLQERRLLRDFYKQMKANRDKDPSGYATLQKILDEKDMAAAKTRWEMFVAKLSYP
jgi:hypothetical protein